MPSMWNIESIFERVAGKEKTAQHPWGIFLTVQQLRSADEGSTIFYTVRRQISVHPSSKRPTSRIVCIVQTRLASEQLDVHACSTEHGDYTEACEDAGGTGDCGLANGDCGFWETVG